jgi:predicted nucleic acid-binding protein
VTGGAAGTTYLLDANVLISAKRDHYRFAVFPCFWDWVLAQALAATVLSVEAVRRELVAGADDLAQWAASLPAGAFLPPDAQTAASAETLSAWVNDPARPYTGAARSTFLASADYWLIAHAHGHGFTVVTHETPQPLAQRRVKIPDACNALSVTWTNPFEMLQREGAAFS